MPSPRTIVQKIWDEHAVASDLHGSELLYIDLHILHEVTSPQAFDGLRAAGRTVRRPDLTLATEDHNVPTIDVHRPIADPMSRRQIEALRRNAAEFGVPLYSLGDSRQGIAHVIAPEQGLSQPGMTIVCGNPTPPPMARSGRWRLALAPARLSMCWPPRPYGRSGPKTSR